MSVTSARNLCFLSGRPLISIWTNVHKVRRLWLVTDIHAYIVDFHSDIADVCADIAENHAGVRNFSQCPLHVRRASADIWDTGGGLRIFAISRQPWPQRFDFCIECMPTDRTCHLYHHQVKIMFIYEGTNNLVSGAFLKYFNEAVLTSTHNLCFRAKIRKNVYPCKPQFYYIKVGCKGVYITQTC